MINEEIWDRILKRMHQEEQNLKDETALQAAKCGDAIAAGGRADQGRLLAAYFHEAGFSSALNKLIMIKSHETDQALDEMVRTIETRDTALTHSAISVGTVVRGHQGGKKDEEN